MSTYYHTCPYCGCNIDPGERCDCQPTTPAPDRSTEEPSCMEATENRKKSEFCGGTAA